MEIKMTTTHDDVTIEIFNENSVYRTFAPGNMHSIFSDLFRLFGYKEDLNRGIFNTTPKLYSVRWWIQDER